MRTASALPLTAVLALAAAIRFPQLLLMDPYTDEVDWLSWSEAVRLNDVGSWFVSVGEDGRPPLLMWLYLAVHQVVPDPVLAGRLVSATAGVLGSAGVVALGAWLFSPPVGLAAGLLSAVYPRSVFLSRMFVDDVLVATCATWAMALAVRSAQSPGAWLALGMGLLVTATFMAKTTGLAFVLAPVVVLLLARSGSDRARQLRFLPLAYLPLAVTALALSFHPDVGRLIGTHGQRNLIGWEELRSLPLERWATNALDLWDWWSVYAGPGLVVLTPIAIALGLVVRPRAAVVLLIPSVVYLSFYVGLAGFWHSRYLSLPEFPIYVLIAFALVSAAQRVGWSKLGSQPLRTMAPVAVLAVGVVAVAFNLRASFLFVTQPSRAPLPLNDFTNYFDSGYSGYGVNAVAEALKSDRSGPAVVVGENGSAQKALELRLWDERGLSFVSRSGTESERGFRAMLEAARTGAPQGGLAYLLFEGAPGWTRQSSEQTEARRQDLERLLPHARSVLRVPSAGQRVYVELFRIEPPDLDTSGGQR